MKPGLVIWIICSFSGISLNGQILYKEASFQSGIEHFYGTGEAPGCGVSFCDFNLDGLDDLTLGGIQGRGLSFYVNNGGTFIELDPLAEIPYEIKQILWVDFDNDLDKDLYVACFDGHNMLFENTGNLVLENITIGSGLPTEIHRGFGALFSDFNRDGWLDLYYVKRRTGTDTILNENKLYLNHPNGTFSEVTDIADVADRGKKPFCAVAIDYDNDKWPDIYINNDKQTVNTLLHNNGNGTFEDVSEESMTNVKMDAMGTAMGDYDNDGWLDMYVSNIPTGNVLLRNNGPDDEGVFTFTDLASFSNTTFNGVAWGTNFLDADNDGDLDLYVNSMLQGESQINSTLYENLGDGTFANLEGQLEGDTCISFSNAIGDCNNDGIADIVVVNQGDFHTQLWKSQPTFNPNNYLKIRLRGVKSNRDGIGTRIEIFTGSHYQMRYTHCGIGFLGQNSSTEIIGLGNYFIIDSIRVTWPTGHVDRLKNINANQTLLITEGSTTNDVIQIDPDITIVTSLDGSDQKNVTSKIFVSPNPATGFIYLSENLTGKFSIYNSDGRCCQSGYLNKSKEINVQSLPGGLYQIIFITNEKAYSGTWSKL